MKPPWNLRQTLLIAAILFGLVYLCFFSGQVPFLVLIAWAALTYFWIRKFLKPRRR